MDSPITTESISPGVHETVDYRERLIQNIIEKTGRVPELSKIQDTVERWVRKMESGGKAGKRKEVDDDLPIELLVPGGKGLPQLCGLWSIDELKTLKSRQEEEKKRTISPFDKAKWLAKAAKGYGQSPINIDKKIVKRCWFKPLQIEGLFDRQSSRITNDGHTMKICLECPAYLSEGPLFGKYKFLHTHFHWSENGKNGTEHAIDGRRYALEAHFVFEPDSCVGYRSIVRKEQRHSLCVIAVLFKETKEAPFYHTFSYASQVIEPNKEVWIDGNCLKDFQAALATSEYYNYSGSLTTPPYTEPVEWIVLKQVMPIQKRQVDCIRALKGHSNDRIANCVRTLQDVGLRKVICNITSPGQIFCDGQELEECICDF